MDGWMGGCGVGVGVWGWVHEWMGVDGWMDG